MRLFDKAQQGQKRTKTYDYETIKIGEGKNPFVFLPDETVCNILEFLKPKEIVGAARGVDKYFKWIIDYYFEKGIRIATVAAPFHKTGLDETVLAHYGDIKKGENKDKTLEELIGEGTLMPEDITYFQKLKSSSREKGCANRICANSASICIFAMVCCFIGVSSMLVTIVIVSLVPKLSGAIDAAIVIAVGAVCFLIFLVTGCKAHSILKKFSALLQKSPFLHVADKETEKQLEAEKESSESETAAPENKEENEEISLLTLHK